MLRRWRWSWFWPTFFGTFAILMIVAVPTCAILFVFGMVRVAGVPDARPDTRVPAQRVMEWVIDHPLRIPNGPRGNIPVVGLVLTALGNLAIWSALLSAGPASAITLLIGHARGASPSRGHEWEKEKRSEDEERGEET